MAFRIRDIHAIHNNQLNKSVSKQQYSIPKADRFRRCQTVLTDKYYDLPSTNELKGALIGGENRKNIFTVKDQGPSPGHYNVSEIKIEVKNIIFPHGRQECKQDGFLEQKTKTPGPGTYNPNPEANFRSTNKFSFLTSNNKNKVAKTEDTPGPGSYPLKSSWLQKQKILSTEKKSGCILIRDTNIKRKIKEGQTLDTPFCTFSLKQTIPNKAEKVRRPSIKREVFQLEKADASKTDRRQNRNSLGQVLSNKCFMQCTIFRIHLIVFTQIICHLLFEQLLKMSCCKPNTPPPEIRPKESPKPKYKYSFKHHSKILVDTMHSSQATYPIESTKQNSPQILDEHQLQEQYNALKASERELDSFIVNKVKPLEDQVKFYEYQVVARRKEIQDLEELLRAVKRMRGSVAPPGNPPRGTRMGADTYR